MQRQVNVKEYYVDGWEGGRGVVGLSSAVHSRDETVETFRMDILD